MSKPTGPQLKFLTKLHYVGTPPISKAEASFLIDGRKSGEKSQVLEKAMLKNRATSQRKWFRAERRYVATSLREAQASGGAVVGFRITTGSACSSASGYDRAFLPIQIAKEHPNLLPPYDGICQRDQCECEFEEVMEDEILPLDSSMIVAPGKMATVGEYRKRGSKSGKLLVMIVLALVAILYWVLR